MNLSEYIQEVYDLSNIEIPRPSDGRQAKAFQINLMTIKYHFLGDYVQHIRHWGTTDSYSTQLVFIFLSQQSNTPTY